jgi:hypothetical protein
MKILVIILAFTFFIPGDSHAGYDVDKLARAVNPIYPIWKINKKKGREEYGYQLIFNRHNPKEIEIPNFKKILNGQHYILLSCYGRIIPLAKNGYIVGTANEGPTPGYIILFDENLQKIDEIKSQKVVKIKLLDLLGEDTLQIITWEDHHYGTNTTRRVLNIYKIDAGKGINRIFSHDIVDATFMPGDHEIHYQIDYRSLIKKKQIIIVNEDSGRKEVYSWDGGIYKGEDCQQRNPGDAE